MRTRAGFHLRKLPEKRPGGLLGQYGLWFAPSSEVIVATGVLAACIVPSQRPAPKRTLL
jgi:hypothetical protein